MIYLHSCIQEAKPEDTGADPDADGDKDSTPIPISQRREKRAATQGKMYKESFLYKQAVERSKREMAASNPETAQAAPMMIDEDEDLGPGVMIDYLLGGPDVRMKAEKWVFKRPRDTWPVKKQLTLDAGLRINRPDNQDLANMGFDFGLLRNIPSNTARRVACSAGQYCPPGIDYRRGSIRVAPGLSWRARLDRCSTTSQFSLLLKELDLSLQYEQLKRPYFVPPSTPNQLPTHMLSKTTTSSNSCTNQFLLHGVKADARQATKEGFIEYLLEVDQGEERGRGELFIIERRTFMEDGFAPTRDSTLPRCHYMILPTLSPSSSFSFPPPRAHGRAPERGRVRVRLPPRRRVGARQRPAPLVPPPRRGEVSAAGGGRDGLGEPAARAHVPARGVHGVRQGGGGPAPACVFIPCASWILIGFQRDPSLRCFLLLLLLLNQNSIFIHMYTPQTLQYTPKQSTTCSSAARCAAGPFTSTAPMWARTGGSTRSDTDWEENLFLTHLSVWLASRLPSLMLPELYIYFRSYISCF